MDYSEETLYSMESKRNICKALDEKNGGMGLKKNPKHVSACRVALSPEYPVCLPRVYIFQDGHQNVPPRPWATDKTEKHLSLT